MASRRRRGTSSRRARGTSSLVCTRRSPTGGSLRSGPCRRSVEERSRRRLPTNVSAALPQSLAPGGACWILVNSPRPRASHRRAAGGMNPPERIPTVHPLAAVPLDPPRVGWRFITLYALSYAGGSLLFLGPLLVSLALKVNDLVGIGDAPRSLALVTGVGSLFAIVSNPLFGRLSDRTTSRLGMR